ncbi:hypothetical protein M427DRAFT_49970 [Gonapodya prolifera JEL478]|uniref:MFS general substrate transporter n=1 Tax=Gonapodya prolifera (strain JEL478) TaxID=1344416 RepID=A0A138ZX85_GONPJ|nr:hypothetical protein M427DRAFT_49970 [Gonapodya prolifera JEL478]|eukprot:KXS09109.1 hypothetical protein M427DRAFT_49970 [Gonapodya prolifera JEL478]
MPHLIPSLPRPATDSIYSFPNIVLLFLGGVVVDVFGASRTVLLFGALVLVGQVMFAAGVAAKSHREGHPLETINEASVSPRPLIQLTIATEWFQHHPILGLSLALAINLSSVRIVTALNDIISPLIANRFGIPCAPFAEGWLLPVMMLNVPKERAKRKEKDVAHAGKSTFTGKGNGCQENDSDAFGGKDDSATLLHPLPRNPQPLKRAGTFREKTSISVALIDGNTGGLESKIKTPSLWSSLRPLGLKFWVLLLLVVTSHAVSNPFYTIATDFFQETWFMGDPEKAGFVLGLRVATLSTVLWSMVPEAADVGFVASTFGLTAVLNLTLTIIPLLWIKVELFFVLTATIGIVLCGVLAWVERRDVGIVTKEMETGVKKPLLNVTDA